MTVLRGAERNRYLDPGTPVRLSILVNERDLLEPDFGVVVHCWQNNSEGVFVCYVAFFGEHFPTGEPSEEPYVLKHATSSLGDLAG